tara:strand:- start:239 stop:646 length:408 start_codon:yes stop_codon:yes gene_type:complete
MKWFDLLKYDVFVEKPLPLVDLSKDNSKCCDVAFDELEKYLMDVLDSKEQVGYSQFGLSTALERLQKYRTRKNKCSYIYKYLNQRSVEGTGSGLLNLKTRKILEDWDACERKDWKWADSDPQGYGDMDDFRGKYQ